MKNHAFMGLVKGQMLIMIERIEQFEEATFGEKIDEERERLSEKLTSALKQHSKCGF